MRTDGFLTIYDSNLAPLYAPSPSIPGIQAGGYYGTGAGGPARTAITYPLDGGNIDRIVVPDNRQSLLKLNAESASLVEPPAKMWERRSMVSPVVVSLGALGPGIAGVGTSSNFQYSLLKLNSAGASIWSAPIEGYPLNDIVPAKLDTDDITDLIYQWGTDGDLLLRTRGVSGATGGTLWNGSLRPGAGRQPPGSRCRTGTRMVSTMSFCKAETEVQRALSGTNGLVITANGLVQDAYALTIHSMWMETASKSHLSCHVRSGAPSHSRRSDYALGGQRRRPSVSLWLRRELPREPDGICNGSYVNQARLKLTPSLAPTAGGQKVVLAGGRLIPPSRRIAAGAKLGQLTSTAVHGNLTGHGRPSVVVGPPMVGCTPSTLAPASWISATISAPPSARDVRRHRRGGNDGQS